MFLKNSLQKAVSLVLIAICSAGLLTACGSDDDRKNAKNHGHDHHHGHHVDDKTRQEVSQGRLLFADNETKKLYVYSIAEKKFIQELSLDTEINWIQTSPDGRYAMFVNSKADMIKFYDSGLLIEDHGDHDYPYAKDVSLLNTQLTYPKPAHYQVHYQSAGLFFDGKGKDGNPLNDYEQKAGFALITDKTIEKNQIPYQQLANNMHGTVEILSDKTGTYAIATARRTTTGSSLADGVAVYEQHDDHFHKESSSKPEIANIETLACPSLHGSISIGNSSLFACADGLIKVSLQNGKFAGEKIVNNGDIVGSTCQRQDGSVRPARIGSFSGHQKLDYVIGHACGQVYQIKNGNMKKLTWTTDNSLKVSDMVFTKNAENMALLDSANKLHVLSTKTDKPVFSAIAFDVDAELSLINNPNSMSVYLVDRKNKQLIVIDKQGKLTKTSLSFTPSAFNWVGVKTK